MRIGTKSFGLSYKQVGLWFFRPLRFGSTPPLSRLCRLNVYYSVTQHSPLCTNCFRWDSWYLLSWSFMIFYDVHLYLLMQIIWSEAPEIYKTSSISSLHWCGAWDDTFGGKFSSSSWGKETFLNIEIVQYIAHLYTNISRVSAKILTKVNPFNSVLFRCQVQKQSEKSFVHVILPFKSRLQLSQLFSLLPECHSYFIFQTRQSKQCGFSIYIFDNSKSKSMVKSEKMPLSGLVFARKIARMILIQNI